MKKFLAILMATAMVLALAACGGASISAPANAPASSTAAMTSSVAEPAEEPVLDPVTLNIAYMPNYSSLVEVVTADQMGYFEEQGITVNLVEFADGPTIIAAMENGSIDIGYIGSGAHGVHQWPC
ncbi:MAG: ABC transporter substrate-binding protein [Ruthenibacterium lactatiformans]